MTFADRIDSMISSALGDSFESYTNDNMQIVLSVTRMVISNVDMEDETITADFYGFAVPDSIYNSDMVQKNGGEKAVAQKLAMGGIEPKVVATTKVLYNGDDSSEIGKALVALRDVWEEVRA